MEFSHGTVRTSCTEFPGHRVGTARRACDSLFYHLVPRTDNSDAFVTQQYEEQRRSGRGPEEGGRLPSHKMVTIGWTLVAGGCWPTRDPKSGATGRPPAILLPDSSLTTDPTGWFDRCCKAAEPRPGVGDALIIRGWPTETGRAEPLPRPKLGHLAKLKSGLPRGSEQQTSQVVDRK